MIHDESSLRSSSIRTISATVACLRFNIFSHDVTQAYLQSNYLMTRDVYINPKPSDSYLSDLKEGEVLKAELPLYTSGTPATTGK